MVLALALRVALASDAPEISRSVGEPGGIVVLWPRIIPATTDPAVLLEARNLQLRWMALAERTSPGVQLDLRPEPERVCPRAGCKAVAVGAVLHHNAGGCVAVATVSAPGASPATLVPWGGLVELKAAQSAFREPPESLLTIRDFVPCAGLAGAGASQDAAVAAALAAAR